MDERLLTTELEMIVLDSIILNNENSAALKEEIYASDQ